MHWYGGNIAEAVALSKQRNAIFVVFVEGDNDLSTEMAQIIDDSAVVKRLSNQDNFLAVKLKSGSPNYTHFAQIYQFVPVPSLFFIGRNGTPLEVVCAGVQPENLATRIDRILEEHHKEKPPTVHPSTSKQNVKEQTADLLQSEAAANVAQAEPATSVTQAETMQAESVANSGQTASAKSAPINIPPEPMEVEPETSSGPAAKIQKTVHHEVTKSGKEYEVVCDGDVCVRRPKVKPDDSGPSRVPTTTQEELTAMATVSEGNIEEKIEKVKELIEVRRREKAEKEKELERQKELERRATGQGVAELKRWQAEQELKQIQEERRREKMENNLARQRILEQIAQDRAERRARDTTPAPAQPTTPTAAQPEAPPTSGDGSGRARIQLKLPDGSSHTAHFDAGDTLAQLQRYVADNLHLSTSSFSLWTAFPRRELIESEASLRQLQLAPSAALLVLPRRTPNVVASPTGLSALIAFFTQMFTSLILEPSQQLYAWVRARLAPAGAPGAAGASGPPAGAGGPPAPRSRRPNVHRLTGDTTGDDDNNTWNGNSTQQM